MSTSDTLIPLATLVVLCATLVVLIWYTVETRGLRKATLTLLKQTTRANAGMVRLTHNWKLFENEVDPGLPGLPAMADDKHYWKWRMVHLDHINLLFSQWQARQDDAIGEDELRGWVRWATLLLKVLEEDRKKALAALHVTNTEVASEVNRQLMRSTATHPRLIAFLHISELNNWDLFPKCFVDWLLKKCQYDRLGLSPVREDGRVAPTG